MIGTCNLCKKFKVPWDAIGAAIMKQHQMTDCPGDYQEATEAARQRVDSFSAEKREEITARVEAAYARAEDIIAGRRDPLDG